MTLHQINLDDSLLHGALSLGGDVARLGDEM